MGLLQELILTACIVDTCLKCVQPHNKWSDQAVAGEIDDDEKKIRGNLQDLFDTIVRHDTKKSETFRTILEQEVMRKQQDFHAVKEEFQFARNKKFHRRGTAGKNIEMMKRQVDDKKNYDLEFDLSSLEYNGTWTDFCNKTKIEDDFSAFGDHDVKRIRLLICQLKDRNQINRQSLPTFSTYKYCHMIRASTDRSYQLLKKKFDEHFMNRLGEIPEAGPRTDECYTTSMDTFHQKCMGRRNPCVRMFQSLISSTCVRPGITAGRISKYMTEVCAGDYVTDEIDWMPIDFSLKYYVKE